MRPFLGARERGWLGGSAFAGLVAAHALTYFIVAPGHHDRDELLHASGHGDWTIFFLLAGAAFVAGLVALSNRWASPVDANVPLRRLYGYAWRRLLPLQVIGFLGLEALERSLSHGSPLAMFGERAVLLGIVVQIVVAVLCGLLLVGFTRLVRRLRKTGDHPRARISLAPVMGAIVVPHSVARRAWNSRGPPLLTRSS